MINNATVFYQEAMQKSGYHNELKYQHSSSHTIPAKTKKKKKTKNFMVQPPFSEHVKTNIGRTFLNLLEMHFPPSSPPHNLQHKHCENQL